MPSDIDEKTFETSFAEMALTSLKDRAPALVDYMMGFQLVERSEDDSRAAGFFGFKVGPAWVYVPAIFLGGEVKGLELMYIKDQDLFLPLEEDWVNYLIQRRPFSLGKGAPRDVKQQGITGPDLRRLRFPPTKTAADRGQGLHIYSLEKTADWAAPAMQMFAEKQAELLTLPQYLAHTGQTPDFIRLMKRNPKVAQAALRFYQVQDLVAEQEKTAAARKQAACGGYQPRVETPDDKKKDKVKVLDRMSADTNHSELAFLSDEEKRRLMTGQVLISDNRSPDGVRHTYNVELTKSLSNPQESGLYDVLNAGGDFSKMLVLVPSPVGGGGNRDLRLMIDPQDGSYQLAWKTQIWVAKQYERLDLEELLPTVGQTLDSRPNTGDSWDGDRYVVIDSQGRHALGPFTVSRTVDQNDTTTQWWVRNVQPDVSSYSYPDQTRTPKSRSKPPFEGPFFSEDGEIDLRADGQNNSCCCWSSSEHQLIISDKKLSKIIHSDHATMVPRDAGFRLLKLGQPLTGVRCLGVQVDLHMRIGKFAEAIKIYNNGLQLNIVGDQLNETVSVTNVKRAYEVLLQELNLSQESASQMLKEAQAAPHRAVRYYAFGPQAIEKQAAPFDQVGTTSMDPWVGVPVQETSDGGSTLVEQLPEYRTDDGMGRELYRHLPGENDAFQQYYQDDMQELNQAAETGQKDVFDASAIGALIKVRDVGGEIDSFVPKLISALDKLGRTLFFFYWHSEEIQERYGKQEVRDLEDNVKSVFQSLGETVIALKKQSPADEDFLAGGLD